jgi:hypothetical protein
VLQVVPQADLPLTDAEGNVLIHPETLLDRHLIPRNNEPVVHWLVKWINLPETAAISEDADFIRKIFPNFKP